MHWSAARPRHRDREIGTQNDMWNTGRFDIRSAQLRPYAGASARRLALQCWGSAAGQCILLR